MSKTIRTKFKCHSKREYYGLNKQLEYEYQFSAVKDGSPEKKNFWKFTPAGNVSVSTVFIDTFQVGKEYYLDFIEAVEAI